MVFGHSPYRPVIIALLFIMYAIIIADVTLHSIPWAKASFYFLTQALLIFRLFGRNFLTISIHAFISTAVLVMLYLHYYYDYGDPDYEFYRPDEAPTNYKITDIQAELRLSESSFRSGYKRYWLIRPLLAQVVVSLSGFCFIIGLSLNMRKMFASIHGVAGLTIVMVFYYITVFYSSYFKSHNLSVIIDMFYYLGFLIILLTPDLINRTQILSHYYTGEDEEEEEEEPEAAKVETVVAGGSL
ncbi:uncharacterized protein ACRADG_004374 [Cochliomyia hominivorax]